MTQDLYYYESGYFDPELGYFVYTADAASAISSTSSLSAACGVIKSADSAMTSAFTVTATISHIEGADLFAFTDAALAAQVNAIRGYNIDVASAFTQTVSGAKFIHFSSDQNSAFGINADNLRVRYSEAATSAAFSLTADIEIVPGGEIVSATGAWTSNFDIDANGTRKINIIDCDVTVTTDLSVEANRIRFGISLLESQINTACDADLIAGGAASVDVTAEQSTAANRLRGFDAAVDSAVSLSADAVRSRTASADLNTNASVSATISHIEGADLSAFTNASLSVSAVVTASAVSAVTGQATISATSLRIKQLATAVTSTSTMTTAGALGNKRPRQSTVNGTLTFDSANKSQGTHSLLRTDSSSYLEITASSDFNIASGEDFLIEIAFKRTATGSDGAFVRAYDPANGRVVWQITKNSNSARFSYWNGSSTVNLDTSATTFGTFPSYSISRSGSTLSISAGNSGSGSTTYSGAISSGKPVIQVGIPSGTTYGYYDQFQMVRGATYAPDGKDPNVQFLFHFDNNYIDDMTGIAYAQAALTSSATVSAEAATVKNANSALTTTATLTTTASVVKSYQADLACQGFIFAAVGRIQPETAGLDSSFSMSIEASKVRNVSADLSSQSTLTASALDLDQASIALTATSSLTALARTNGQLASALTASAQLTCIPDRVYLQLIYGAGNTSGYITTSGTNIHDTFSEDLGGGVTVSGFRAVQTNFSISLDQPLTNGQQIVVYTNGSNSIILQKGGNWPDGTSAGTSYIIYVKNTIKYCGLASGGTRSIYLRTYYYGTDLGSSWDPTEWHNIHIPLSLGATGSPSNYFGDLITLPAPYYSRSIEGGGTATYQSDSLRIDGQQVWITHSFDNVGDESNIGSTGSWFAPTENTLSTHGGDWGASNAPMSVYLDTVWIATPTYSVLTPTLIPSSEFYTGTYETAIFGGLTPGGFQAQVWLPWGNLLDHARSTAPTWDYVSNNRVVPGLVKLGESFQTVTASIAATILRIKQLAAGLSSAFTQTTVNGRLRYGSSSQTSAFAQSTIGQKNAILSSVQSVTATLAGTGKRYRAVPAALSTSSTMTVNAVKVTVTQGAFTATVTQIVDNNRLRAFDSDQSLEASLASAVNYGPGQLAATLQVQAFELTAAVKTGVGHIDPMDTTSQLTAVVKVIAYSETHMSSQAQLTAEPIKAIRVSADLTSSSTQACIPTYLRRNESVMVVNSTISINATKVVRLASTQSASTTVSAVIKRTRSTAVALQSTATMTCTGRRVRFTDSAMASQFTVPFCVPGILVRFTANLTAFDTQLTAGRVLHIDPYYQIIIKPEVRRELIKQETRELIVKPETRVNIIRG